MAHFFGTVKGQRGIVSRLGGKASGLTTVAASWNGAVKSTLFVENGVDMCEVRLMPWHGHGVDQLLYRGPVGEPAKMPELVNA